MEVPNDGSEAVYAELYTNEASEGFGMSANQSYGGMASTRAEEEVHTYEGVEIKVIASTEAEVSDEGFGMGANQNMALPRAEEEMPSNEAIHSGMASTTGDEERSERRKGSFNKIIHLWLFAILVVSLLSVAGSIGFALEILKLKSETALIQQELEALRDNL
jgi:hypothetical protein